MADYSALHDKLVSDMLKRLEKGDLTAAEWTAVAKFLKDNNFSALPEHNPGVRKIGEELNKRSQDEDDDSAPIPFPISK